MPFGGAGVPWYGDIALTFATPVPNKQPSHHHQLPPTDNI